MDNFILRLTAFAFVAVILTAFSSNAQQTQNRSESLPPQIIRKSTGYFQTSAIRRVLPEYPQEARAKRLAGEVIIEVLVGIDGSVISTKPVSGDRLLAAAAMKALKDWKFIQTHLSGVPLQVIGNAVFTFASDGTVTEGSTTYPVKQEAKGQIVKGVSLETAQPDISKKEGDELFQKLENSYDIPIRINNPEGIVVEITKATVRAVKRDESNYMTGDTFSSYVTDYAMQAAIALHNRTAKAVSGVTLKFTNIQSQHTFFIARQIPEMKPADSQPVQINLMTIAGDPTNLQIEVVGVGFGDGTKVGASNLYSTSQIKSPPINNPQVDTKPRPLNHLFPRYTERARLNRVIGAVRLSVDVGADGSVKNLRVINALPDGLTDEAIRILKVLQFKPAMLNGSPVDYTIMMEVEFHQQ